MPRSTYQRKSKSNQVQKIVKEFDEHIANEPKVSYRNGRYYVFDGQHTIAARKLRNNNQDLNVLCKVYYGMTEMQEALLFAEQTGETRDLTPGEQLRARVFGDDPESIAFVKATESVGLKIDYDQQRGRCRIGCVATALDQYRKVGEKRYKEGLAVIVSAWKGDPESLRAETLTGVIQFVDLYHGEFDPMRLISRLRKVDALTIYREGRAMGVNLAGSKKYLYQVWKIYNGTGKTHTLPIKF